MESHGILLQVSENKLFEKVRENQSWSGIFLFFVFIFLFLVLF